MSRSWLSLAGDRFAGVVKETISECGRSVLSGGLGDEDTQCQHLFTSIFTRLQAAEVVLADYLVKDAEIRDLVMVLRYYRSRRRRKKKGERIQFVESETGADFALSLQINLPTIAQMNRHTLAQVKLVDAGRVRVDRKQLQKLDEAAGGELGVYAIWGENLEPSILTIANLKAVVRATTSESVRSQALERFSRRLHDYLVDDFLGLWHGADFYSEEWGEEPPPTSPPALFHLLHKPPAPPNVFHMDITVSRLVRGIGMPAVPPGFYVVGIDSDTGEPFER